MVERGMTHLLEVLRGACWFLLHGGIPHLHSHRPQNQGINALLVFSNRRDQRPFCLQ